MSTDTTVPTISSEADLREEALRRLEKKRAFQAHLLAYAMVHTLLWAIWVVVFVASGVSFPWPLIPMFGWGIGLAFHAWDVYGRPPFSEEDIRREEAQLSK
jgi:hypothetical protein